MQVIIDGEEAWSLMTTMVSQMIDKAGLSGDGKAYSGMGAAFADYDNDGLPDLIITNLALEKWAVYRNDGGRSFSYATMATGMAALTARTSGWGVGLYDFDNDGWKDVFAARSHPRRRNVWARLVSQSAACRLSHRRNDRLSHRDRAPARHAPDRDGAHES